MYARTRRWAAPRRDRLLGGGSMLACHFALKVMYLQCVESASLAHILAQKTRTFGRYDSPSMERSNFKLAEFPRLQTRPIAREG